MADKNTEHERSRILPTNVTSINSTDPHTIPLPDSPRATQKEFRKIPKSDPVAYAESLVIEHSNEKDIKSIITPFLKSVTFKDENQCTEVLTKIVNTLAQHSNLEESAQLVKELLESGSQMRCKKFLRTKTVAIKPDFETLSKELLDVALDAHNLNMAIMLLENYVTYTHTCLLHIAQVGLLSDKEFHQEFLTKVFENDCSHRLRDYLLLKRRKSKPNIATLIAQANCPNLLKICLIRYPQLANTDNLASLIECIMQAEDTAAIECTMQAEDTAANTFALMFANLDADVLQSKPNIATSIAEANCPNLLKICLTRYPQLANLDNLASLIECIIQEEDAAAYPLAVKLMLKVYPHTLQFHTRAHLLADLYFKDRSGATRPLVEFALKEERYVNALVPMVQYGILYFIEIILEFDSERGGNILDCKDTIERAIMQAATEGYPKILKKLIAHYEKYYSDPDKSYFLKRVYNTVKETIKLGYNNCLFILLYNYGRKITTCHGKNWWVEAMCLAAEHKRPLCMEILLLWAVNRPEKKSVMTINSEYLLKILNASMKTKELQASSEDTIVWAALIKAIKAIIKHRDWRPWTHCDLVKPQRMAIRNLAVLAKARPHRPEAAAPQETPITAAIVQNGTPTTATTEEAATVRVTTVTAEEAASLRSLQPTNLSLTKAQ